MWLGELITKIGQTKPLEKAIRIQMLHEYVAKGKDHENVLKSYVECMYHPHVVFDLPEGAPPYKQNKVPDYDQAGFSLFNFFHQRYPLYFVKGTSAYIQNNIKREQLFVRSLEGLFPVEADLLIAMKDKSDKKLKNFNEELIREAFPNWLPPKQTPAV